MEKNTKGTIVVAVVVALIAGGVGGYLYGKGAGKTAAYDAGYAQAEEDLGKVQEEAAKRTAEEAAKAANPFGVANPLGDVEADPLAKFKKALNPFD